MNSLLEQEYLEIREEFGIDKGDYLAVSAEGGKIVFQKVKLEIDWENSDDVWKEYAAKKLAEELCEG